MKEKLKQLPKYYRRMAVFIPLLFEQNEVISRSILLDKLITEQLKDLFEKIYKPDGKCSGEWSFFDYPDRFARFADSLSKRGLIEKVGWGKYRTI